jgi:(R,R)-butanediol dehydrogenase/meso-butanediol dehydrogenase/diacetyl reductase
MRPVLAARWWGRGDVRVEHIDDPGDPRPGWVRLRIDACGICGTDLEEYTAGPNVVPVQPHALSGASAPLILGHEAVGVVEAVGDGVGLAPGIRVAVEGDLSCGTCWWCRRGDVQLCPDLAQLGLMADGGLAEVMLAPASMCAAFSDAIEPAHAAMAEPLSVAVRAVERAGVSLGSTVGVFGAGAVGLLVIQAARLAGAQTVVAVERLAGRRALALALGADAAVTPDDALAASLEHTEGTGLDITIEAAGNPSASAAAVRLVRRGGRSVLLGVYDETLPIDMMDMLLGEKTVSTSLSHVYHTDFRVAVSLIERGKVLLEPIITDRIPLADVVERGFKTLLAEPDEHLKVIVFPNGLAAA